HGIEGLRLLHVEAEAVDVALAGDVARKGVQAVRPPEARAGVVVEGQHLTRKWPARTALDRQIAIENVENFRAVLEEKPVADAVIADAIAHDEIVGAVHGEPAVLAVPQRCADDGAAAHRIAHQMEVQHVAAKRAALAETAELGVADRAGRAVVVHRVATRGGVGRLDDDVAAQVGDLAAIRAAADVVEVRGAIEHEAGTGNGGDKAFFRLREVADALLKRIELRLLQVDDLTRRRGQDDPIALAPAADRPAEHDLAVATPDRRAELDPRAAERRTVQFHAAAAALNRGQRIAIKSREVHQADEGGVRHRNGLVGRADKQCGARNWDRRALGHEVGAVFRRNAADLDQADIEAGIAIACEHHAPLDVEHANGHTRVNVVEDFVPGPDGDNTAGRRQLTALPRAGARPRSAANRAHAQRCGGPTARVQAESNGSGREPGDEIPARDHGVGALLLLRQRDLWTGPLAAFALAGQLHRVAFDLAGVADLDLLVAHLARDAEGHGVAAQP